MKKAVFLLLGQFAIMAVLSLAAYLFKPIPWLHGVLKWAVIPLTGAASAFLLVRKGLNAYISWFMPPFALAAAGIAITMGLLPDGGALVLCAFLSIVGAATGETCNKYAEKGRK